MRLTRKEKRRVRANLDLTPLIDVVFQLLIFFMLTSTFVVQTSVPLDIPTSEAATQMERKDITISLQTGPGGPDGLGPITVTMDEDVAIASWSDLVVVLQGLLEENPEALVLLRADRNVTTQRLLEVLGQANSAGVTRYGIAAQQPEVAEASP